MDEYRKIYRNFLSLNAQKAAVTETPVAHVMFYRKGTTMSPAQPLIAMSKEDLLKELDSESELVRWLMHQMCTYDCYKQRIVALIFDSKTVLSDVLRT